MATRSMPTVSWTPVEGDLQLGADAVRAAHEHGLVDAARHRTQAGEAAHVRQHLGDARGLGEGRDAIDQRVARVDVDARILV
jgi:hypothetical protein